MLQAVDLTKKYQQLTALNHLNLTIEKGEIFCLLGQNGAGKTSTIHLFLGFTEPSSGKALVNNMEVKGNETAIKQWVAYIPEVVMLYGHLTAVENLDFFSRLAGYSYRKNELEHYLLLAGLPAQAFGKRLGGYSKGMRQKVGIAIAIAKNAEYIFMDEPTSGLDPKATNEFTEMVIRLGQQGKAVFMATHDIFSAVNTATRIGIMRQGQLVHTIKAADTNARELLALYLETV